MKRELVCIPQTIKAAGIKLSELESITTAKEYEKAAIIWAFTRDGRQRRNSENPEIRTLGEFAALGIVGLTSIDSVGGYRRAWQNAIDAGHAPAVEPGCQQVLLPDLPWRPIERGSGKTPAQLDADRVAPRMKREDVVAEVMKNPDVRRAVVAEVVKNRVLRREVEDAAHEARHDEAAPDRVKSPADRKAIRAQVDEMFEPLVGALSALQVHGAFAQASGALNRLEEVLGRAGSHAHPEAVREGWGELQRAWDSLVLSEHAREMKGIES